MIFDRDYVGLTILDVLTLHQENRRLPNNGLSYSALSFRYDSDTLLESGGQIFDASNTLCHFPAHVPYTRITKRDNLIVIHFECHTYVASQLEMFVPRNPEAYHQLFKEALECWNTRRSGYRLRTTAIMYQILALAYDENKIRKTVHPIVEKALQLIEDGYLRKNYTIGELASDLHISEVYLRRLFHQETGVSPKQYLLHRRIQKAMSLLGTDYFSIADISSQCGFSDPKHFSVAYKKITGKTPTEYANWMKKRVRLPIPASEQALLNVTSSK